MLQSGSSRDLRSPSDPTSKTRWLPATPDLSALQAIWEQSDGSIKHDMLCLVEIGLCRISGSQGCYQTPSVIPASWCSRAWAGQSSVAIELVLSSNKELWLDLALLQSMATVFPCLAATFLPSRMKLLEGLGADQSGKKKK